MRLSILFAVPLVVTLTAAVPLRAQRGTDDARTGTLVPLPTDSVSSAMRGLGLAAGSLLLGSHRAFGVKSDRMPTCPMPILYPDSAKQRAGMRSESLLSGDRMPISMPPCGNPFDKRRERPRRELIGSQGQGP